MISVAETSFLAYLHYLEDIASVVSGRYGNSIAGVYVSLQLHPPVRELAGRSAENLSGVQTGLEAAWAQLAIVDNAVAPDVFDRQSNAVLPGAGVRAITGAAAALAAALGDEPLANDEEALAYLGDLATEELLPYPWSAYCTGCPQLGSADWGGGVLPGDPVSVFSQPSADTADARLAMLLRTTRQRALELIFSIERQTDVRPGRCRRNLTVEHKEAIALTAPPTTLFDVVDRVRRRSEADDGRSFVEGAFDEEEARQFGAALVRVVDTSVAAVEGVVATIIGWELFAELAASHIRRHPSASSAACRRVLSVRA